MGEQGAPVEVPLSRGYVAIIDECDADRVLSISWYASPNHGNFYARSLISSSRVFLHRWLLGAQPGQIVDHANGDTLDNRRANLRFCTFAESSQNRGAKHGSRSRFKGVSWARHARRWRACIAASSRQRHLGYFPTEEAAARAYDAAARELHGEFARLNFPQKQEVAS